MPCGIRHFCYNIDLLLPLPPSRFAGPFNDRLCYSFRKIHLKPFTLHLVQYLYAMKKYALLCTSLFFVTLLPAQSNKDEKEIMDLLNRQTISWNKGNLDEFMSGYWKNDSLMFVGKSGITYGYANTLNNYKKNYDSQEKMGKLFFEILKIKKLAPDYYWVLGKWFLKRSVGDVGGHYTLLFRKIDGKWMIVADHSS